jgi:hypothetical protein
MEVRQLYSQVEQFIPLMLVCPVKSCSAAEIIQLFATSEDVVESHSAADTT